MEIDILRHSLRILQNSIYVDKDSIILSSFMKLELDIKAEKIDVGDSLLNCRKNIFKEIIEKRELFNNTVILDGFLEQYSIAFHKK